MVEPDDNDYTVLQSAVGEFASYFDYDAEELLKGKFLKLFPLSSRPYGRLYTH